MRDRVGFVEKTAATWRAENLVLAQGQRGYETDTRRLKIGTGTLAWNDLPYWGSIIPTREVTGEVHDLEWADMGHRLRCSGSPAAGVLIPLNDDVQFPVGTTVLVQGILSGETIAAVAGVTLNGVDAGSTTISDPYGMATLFKDATDAWTVSGGVAAVA